MSLNQQVLIVFAPVLVLTGVLGFVLPKDKSIMSGEKPYNLFHILFGVMGVLIVLLSSDAWARAFNVTFGAIDLYQAAASFAGWFPIKHFKWKRSDDVLHIVVGAVLAAVGIFF